MFHPDLLLLYNPVMGTRMGRRSKDANDRREIKFQFGHHPQSWNF